MPKYHVFLLRDPEDPHRREGELQVWNLPWERLVFDQRLRYRPPGVAEEGLYKIKDIRTTAQGTVYVVLPDPGNLKGGDPKKDRPPYLTSPR